MSKVILYYRKDDFEIDKLINAINDICIEQSMEFLSINIEKINSILEGNKAKTPNLVVGPYNLSYPFTINDAKIAISAASKAPEKAKKINIEKAKRRNKVGLFLSKYYPSLLGLLISIFVIGAFIPPIMVMRGNTTFANISYGFYKIFCHELAFRSVFLKGEQFVYPRSLAHIDNLITYEQEFNDPYDDINIARNITGNSQSGYKIALCQRDLAIYTSLALVAFLFQIFQKKLKPIKWYYWIIIGLIPIAIDGFSQIPGLSSGWPAWVPIRESTPFLRFLTGTLFGGMTGIYMFPLMEESMVETNNQLLLQREVIQASEKLIK